MLTAEDYTNYIASIEAHGAAYVQALEWIHQDGCCDRSGRNRYWVDVESYDEHGRLFLRERLFRCRVTGDRCPAAELAVLVSLYSRINGAVNNGNDR